MAILDCVTSHWSDYDLSIVDPLITVTNLEKCVIEFRDKLYVVNASTFVEQSRFCIGKMECERGVMIPFSIK